MKIAQAHGGPLIPDAPPLHGWTIGGRAGSAVHVYHHRGRGYRHSDTDVPRRMVLGVGAMVLQRYVSDSRYYFRYDDFGGMLGTADEFYRPPHVPAAPGLNKELEANR